MRRALLLLLACARAQLEADALSEKAKLAAPLPESAPKNAMRSADGAGSMAIRTALPQRKRTRVVTRKLPQVFPHMDYPYDQDKGMGAEATTGRGKGAGDAKGKQLGKKKKHAGDDKDDDGDDQLRFQVHSHCKYRGNAPYHPEVSLRDGCAHQNG